MLEFQITGERLWTRMERAVEQVNERLRKTVGILEAARVPYAIVGGHAVRAWVAQVDRAAVRTTVDVDILVHPDDYPALHDAMLAAGFHHRLTTGLNMFVEEPNASAREAVHVVLAGEMVRPDDLEPNPDVHPVTRADDFQTITLERLVRMKLNSFRDKDRVHIRDMISVGLVDEGWPARFPAPLGERLQRLLDDPLG
jgi:hypothetical protein